MSSDISAQTVKELRDKTGAGMMDCKKALQAAKGDIAQALESLRLKGLASADKKSSRKAAEGIIDSYIHTGGKIGVLLEVNCETDFVARRIEFQNLVKNIAMQIAASPTVEYVSTNDIPSDTIENERRIEALKEDLANKPEQIRDKIVEGRIQKRLKELSLIDQPFIKDQDITIEELVKQNIALLGENIKVARFERFTLGVS
uniref:elongation factor Ts n=1 Tax=Madagascaria erythrocladioides TaxID=753684 RepID=UPI001FCD07A8|nr:elongation factor Ts [Madagascaria erythrocladioides]UNJ16539.1 elongation factor Ts [Madagascaria erythrocladioides]